MQHPNWNRNAELGPLRAVLDPSDTSGFKNSLLDRIHWNAIQPLINGVDYLLDFGCGTGRFAERITRMGIRYSGVDSSPGMIAAAQKFNSAPGLEFRWFDGNHVPFGDGRFDACLSCYVLQHMMDTPAASRLLQEIRRVLVPNARFILIEQASLSGQTSGSVVRASTELGYARYLSELFDVVGISRIRLADVRTLSSLSFRLARNLSWAFESLLDHWAHLETKRAHLASEGQVSRVPYYDIAIEAIAKRQ